MYFSFNIVGHISQARVYAASAHNLIKRTQHQRALALLQKRLRHSSCNGISQIAVSLSRTTGEGGGGRCSKASTGIRSVYPGARKQQPRPRQPERRRRLPAEPCFPLLWTFERRKKKVKRLRCAVKTCNVICF